MGPWFLINANWYYVGDRFISMDLDMVITGDITGLLDRDEDFVYYKMRGSDGTPASGWRMNNGMYMMKTGSRNFVWEIFDKDPEDALRKRVRRWIHISSATLDLI